jgi:putative transferase (TIGR04331 family)
LKYNCNDFQVEWNKELRNQAQEECFYIYESLITELSYELNLYHSINWKVQQYRKLFGNWLIHFIQILYDRWLGCDIGMQLEIENTPWITSDLDDFNIYHTSDEVNASLYKHLSIIKNTGHLMNIELPKKVYCSHSFNTIADSKAPIQIHEPYHFNYSKESKWNTEKNRILFRWKMHNLASEMEIRTNTQTFLEIDKNWRLAYLGQNITSFSEVCSNMARIYIPVVFLEGFCTLRNSAMQTHYPFLYTAISIENNIPFKFINAEWHGRTQLLCHQHGGGYGLDKLNINEYYEKSVSDVFYTWGWVEDEKTRPLSPPPRIKSLPINKRSKILLKCVNYPNYVFRIMYKHMAMENKKLIEQTIQFVKTLKHLNLEISYYAHDYNWNVRNRFVESDALVSEKSSLDAEYLLHTHNYLGSSFLESLAANLPTICFYDPEVNVFRESAQFYISGLEQIGVLHTSPESAAEKVLEIYENPNTWWQSSEVQEVRSAFVHQYARFDDDWMDHWQDEFSRVVDSI